MLRTRHPSMGNKSRRFPFLNSIPFLFCSGAVDWIRDRYNCTSFLNSVGWLLLYPYRYKSVYTPSLITCGSLLRCVNKNSVIIYVLYDVPIFTDCFLFFTQQKTSCYSGSFSTVVGTCPFILLTIKISIFFLFYSIKKSTQFLPYSFNLISKGV